MERKETTATLGPQCLQCRKRRVKCDSTTPACQRCADKGVTCPGYHKKLKFVTVDPSANLRLASGTQLSYKSLNLTPKRIQPFPQDPHQLAMVESVHNYNTYVLPYRTPGQKPFNRQRIYESVPWEAIPEVLRYILILTIKTLQNSRNGLDPSLCSDVRYYRGLCLHGLKQHVHSAVEDPFGTALSAIILLVGADLYIDADSSWLSHLQAAATVIGLRGGLQVCMRDLPFLRAPLVNLMVVDVLSATTSHSSIIFPSTVDSQRALELIQLLPNLQDDLLANSCLCPEPILQAIIRTNLLRAHGNGTCSQIVRSGDTDAPAIKQDIDEILDNLRGFDARIWASTILRSGKPLPEPPEDKPSIINTSALAVVGTCYQSAATLYILLSCCHADDKERQIFVTAAKREVDDAIDYLFALSTADNDGPLHKQFWKFLTWPIVVSLYARVGWDICGLDSDLTSEVERFRRRAKLLRSRSIFSALEHMQRIERGKIITAPATWTWDDGFIGRYGFAI